ncbi:MAG: histidinol-phosphate transaminase [archaeon]
MGLIDLRYGTNPIPLDNAAIASIAAEAVRKLNEYPDQSCTKIKRAIAKSLGRGFSSGNVLVGNGLDSVINTIAESVLGGRKGNGAVAVPSFYVFSAAMRKLGARVLEFPLSEGTFSLDVRKFSDEMKQRGTDLCFLANPNNPTGNLLIQDKSGLLKLAGSCKLLIVDECYYGFCKQTFVRETLELENLVVLRSLSKSYGLAGLRLGYAVSRKENIERLGRVASACRPFDAGTISQEIGTWAVGRKNRLAEFAQLKDDFLRLLRDSCGAEVSGTETSFLLLKVADSEEFGKRLALEGVLVNTLAPYKMGERYVRIGIPPRRLFAKVAKAVVRATNNNKG